MGFELTKPPHKTPDEWLFSLQCEKAQLLNQIRREIHTRGLANQKYMDALDRAIENAKASATRKR